MKATFENSVDVLVKAYLNDKLTHSSCTSCAVTNLCIGWSGWTSYFTTISHEADGGWRRFGFEQISCRSLPTQKTKFGYSLKELAKIEWAFETAPQGGSQDEWVFNGLLAVVEILSQIHNVDLTVKENAIGQFKEVQLAKV